MSAKCVADILNRIKYLTEKLLTIVLHCLDFSRIKEFPVLPLKRSVAVMSFVESVGADISC